MDKFTVAVMPVAKPAEWREFAKSAEGGDRAEDHRNYLRRHGVAREHIFLQETPMGHLMTLVWEGVDQGQAAQIMADLIQNPADEYEKFLVDTVIRDYHGLPADAPPPPPVERIARIEP